MKSPSTLIPDSSTWRSNRQVGFSLIEMIIVIAIVGFLAAFGIIAGIDSYLRYNFRGEADTAAAMLQKARSEAINNIGEARHGVYFGDAANLILFRGDDFGSSDPASHLKMEKNQTVAYGGPTEIVFDQLTGRTTGGNVTLAEGPRSTTITINSEGGIDW